MAKIINFKFYKLLIDDLKSGQGCPDYLMKIMIDDYKNKSNKSLKSL